MWKTLPLWHSELGVWLIPHRLSLLLELQLWGRRDGASPASLSTLSPQPLVHEGRGTWSLPTTVFSAQPSLTWRLPLLPPKKAQTFFYGLLVSFLTPLSWPDCGGVLSLQVHGVREQWLLTQPALPGPRPSFLCSQGFQLFFTEVRRGGGRGQENSPHPAIHRHRIPETSHTDPEDGAGLGLPDSGAGLNHRLTRLCFLLVWG